MNYVWPRTHRWLCWCRLSKQGYGKLEPVAVMASGGDQEGESEPPKTRAYTTVNVCVQYRAIK